jgi:SAM-dependent methyltransferase
MDNNNKMAEYWKTNSLRWEAGAYFEEKTSVKKGLLESISHSFRGRSTYVRMEKACQFLKPYIQNKSLLDIGCASGRFAQMLVEAGAKHVTGVDISDEVVEVAKDNIKSSPFRQQFTFSVADIRENHSSFDQVDITTALGVIEYFTPDDLNQLFANIPSPYFFFHIAGNTSTFRTQFRHFLRLCYLKLKGCPCVYFYDLKQIITVASQYGYTNIWQDGYFVTNLPKQL